MPIKDLPLVIVDIETTGGRYYNHRIIEIGMLKVHNGELIEEYHSMVDPQCLIPDNITHLTGITNDMVTDAPTFRAIHEDIHAFLDGSIFVAHNARFDYGFIKHEFEHVGLRFTSKVLCSVRLSRKLFPQHKRHNLSTIIQRYNFNIDNRHRALDDARVVWDFLKVVDNVITPEQQDRVIKEILKKPSIPPKLKTDTEDIPESCGVYFFRSNEELPLYIGKAKNLRSRVLSHFTDTLRSNKEVLLAQNVTKIDWVNTHGELAALLLESHFIKTQLPLYNRRSRRNWQLTILKVDQSQDYHKVYLEGYKSICKEDLKGAMAVFKTKRQAQQFLEGIAKEYRLCKTLLGLERKASKQSCFYFEIKQCKGACIAQERPVFYNTRLKEALLKHQRIAWPFKGPIMIEESNVSQTKGEVIVVDNWIIQDAFRFDHEQRIPLFELDYQFDLDAFRILYGHIKRTKNLKIKELPELVNNPV